MNLNTRINDPRRPYDDSMWDRLDIYNNVPYSRDSDLCVYDKSIESGNLIKFYRALLLEPYELKN